MKRMVLPMILIFAACKSSPEPRQTEEPEQRSEVQTPETEQPQDPTAQRPEERPMEEPIEQPQMGEQAQTPEQLHDRITAAFQQAEGLDPTRIRIVVADNGVVHLSGTVASEEEKRRAHEIAHAVDGVQNVYIGELEVDTSQATR